VGTTKGGTTRAVLEAVGAVGAGLGGEVEGASVGTVGTEVTGNPTVPGEREVGGAEAGGEGCVLTGDEGSAGPDSFARGGAVVCRSRSGRDDITMT
jgi:hypothetical protein